MSKKTLLLVGVLILVLPGAFPAAAQEGLQGNAQFYFLRGLQFLQSGNYELAVENFQNASLKDPTNAHFHIKAAYCLAELSRYEEALTEAREAMRLNPQSTENAFELIYILERLERYDEALEVAERLTREGYRAVNQEFGWFAAAQYSTARALYRLERYDEARLRVEEALRLSPSNVAMNSLLGDILLRMNDPEEAIAVYRHAAEMNPEKSAPWRGLCAAANQLGLFEESITAYQTAAELSNNAEDLESGLTNEELESFYQASREGRIILLEDEKNNDEDK